ncbi:uncharacterized protein BDW43DRAFT_114957 [Aspergillus alliaceus]|uniref:uncharacterized protein n=1 Tax=Petromyces alliaceus TaxID=209559 RepID=UPI0012A701FC|nr:uncharacterized protein BDW43DRAFT_114957 [Aspergillus alliaceus]KAB8238345.1 hypothetical protein BDW43DRAFT_114957 [Aspergillus alliaceus]
MDVGKVRRMYNPIATPTATLFALIVQNHPPSPDSHQQYAHISYRHRKPLPKPTLNSKSMSKPHENTHTQPKSPVRPSPQQHPARLVRALICPKKPRVECYTRSTVCPFHNPLYTTYFTPKYSNILAWECQSHARGPVPTFPSRFISALWKKSMINR